MNEERKSSNNTVVNISFSRIILCIEFGIRTLNMYHSVTVRCLVRGLVLFVTSDSRQKDPVFTLRLKWKLHTASPC